MAYNLITNHRKRLGKDIVSALPELMLKHVAKLSEAEIELYGMEDPTTKEWAKKRYEHALFVNSKHPELWNEVNEMLPDKKKFNPQELKFLTNAGYLFIALLVSN